MEPVFGFCFITYCHLLIAYCPLEKLPLKKQHGKKARNARS